MPRKLTIMAVLLFISLGCAGQPERILFSSYAEQWEFRDSLSNRLDAVDTAKATRELAGLAGWADKKGDAQLTYAFTATKYRYLIGRELNLGKSLNDKPLEAALVNLYATVRREKLQLLQAEVSNLLGNYYWWAGQYSRAFEYLLYSYDDYEPLSQAELPQKANYLFELASKYYNFRDFNSAKKYLLESYQTIPPDRNTPYITSLNTLALCYRNLAMYDSAAYYLDTAYKRAIIENSAIWKGILGGNIGSVYYLQGKYDKAMPLIEQDVDTCLKDNREVFNGANSLALLSDIYLRQGNKQKALAAAQRAYDILLKRGHIKNYEFADNILYRLARAYAASGDMTRAYLYIDSSRIARDSAASHASLLVLTGVQYQMDANRRMEEQLKLDRDKRIDAWLRTGLIAGVAMLLAIMILLISRQRLKQRQDEQSLQNEKVQAKNALDNAAEKLTYFTRILAEKNEIIDGFTGEISRLKRQIGDTGATADDEAIRKLQQATILTDEQWSEFARIFETAHRGFIDRLRQTVPGLSPVDTRFMLLCKLRLSAKQMAGVLGISADAVRHNRQRLSEKLGLPDGGRTLEEYADSI